MFNDKKEEGWTGPENQGHNGPGDQGDRENIDQGTTYHDPSFHKTRDPHPGGAQYKEDKSHYEYQGPPRRKKDKKGPKWIAWALIFSLLGGLIGGSFSWYFLSKNMTGQGASPISIHSGEEMGQVEAVATKAMPSVVGITTKDIQMTPFGPVPVEGSGSGFILSEDGYILSNAHVVGNKDNKVNVLLDDGATAEGRVVWSDSTLDLGLVKINKKGLVPIELGDSDTLNIGELAVAIGNPLGLDFQRTVTSGVVSGLNRNIGEVEGNYMDGLIQTDASINSGNSGGPLLNKEGKVVGINTVKIAVAEGIGFSIPINTVKPIIEQVMETGDFRSVSLGILPASISAIEKSYKLDLGTKGKGVVVLQVEKGSPAEAAGLKANDIILSFQERPIDNTEQLRRELYNYKVGDQLDVKIVREGKEKTLSLTFTDYQVEEKGDPSQIKPFGQ